MYLCEPDCVCVELNITLLSESKGSVLRKVLKWIIPHKFTSLFLEELYSLKVDVIKLLNDRVELCAPFTVISKFSLE